MTIPRVQADRIIHDIKNLLSALLLGVGNLENEHDRTTSRQPNQARLASMILEMSALVDELAAVTVADSRLRRPRPYHKIKSAPEGARRKDVSV